MEKLVTSNFKLGIIAGGQLGKMLIQEATKWDIVTYVLDKDDTCPASKIATHHIIGDNTDYDAVYHFGKQVDMITYEIENINIEALKKLKTEGHKIIPDPEVLEFIQDKGQQKQFYEKNKISTSPFSLFANTDEIRNAIAAGQVNFPFVQKFS